jgi:hypothetical protein
MMATHVEWAGTYPQAPVKSSVDKRTKHEHHVLSKRYETKTQRLRSAVDKKGDKL